jgi:Fic family protein
MSQVEEWQPIEPLPGDVEKTLNGDLAAVDALKAAWVEFAQTLSEADRVALRRRTLRKHAIETGILERLYQIDWGVTETLVAEGFTLEAIARSGGDVSEGTLAMLQAQLEGLEMAIEFARGERALTTSFIKEVHALITRTQETYEATDSLGRRVRAPLQHGTYKRHSNNVVRADGSTLEFCPPEQVAGEIERLVTMYDGVVMSSHPIVSAAWLHHRFVQIHPFEDGNGRVARALTLLSLERYDFPPIVVDRESRPQYLVALDEANAGDLTPLARLFSRLGIRSIRRELELPVEEHLPRTAEEVARAFAKQLRRRRDEEAEQRAVAARNRAIQLHGSISRWFERAGTSLEAVFGEEGIGARTATDSADPQLPEKSKWWRYQIIESAKRADHYADLSGDTWWNLLTLTVAQLQLKFVASIHPVGSPRTGVMAITTFGDVRPRHSDEPSPPLEDVYVATSWDAFTFTHTEPVEDRADELTTWLDESLAVALDEFRKALGS